MLNKDSFILGIILGIIIPAIVFGLLYLAAYAVKFISAGIQINAHVLLLVSFLPNLFIMRYYLVNRKLDKTGRGILLITFIYFILYFLIVHKWQI
jgi:hypothetical protein